jgi:hypothetical protein
MKIKTTTGDIIDTDKLPDKQAEVTEAINNLFKVCHKYNVTFLCRAVLNDRDYLGAVNMAKGPKKKINAEIVFLLSLLAAFVVQSTNGKYQFVQTGK